MKWVMVKALFGPVFRPGFWGSNMTSCLWPGEGMEGGEEGRRERDWEEIGEVQIFLLLLISLSRDEKEEGKMNDLTNISTVEDISRCGFLQLNYSYDAGKVTKYKSIQYPE